jgi:large subunit ribosomal protein L15
MKLHELPKGRSKKSKKRVGRGHGSGLVKTAGRGQKGQKSRAGVHLAPVFQGGGIPMFRRLPKLGGFISINRVEYTPVNLGALNCFEDGTDVNLEKLREAGIITKNEKRIKVLAGGKQLEKKLKIHAHAWSKSAEEKAKEAGSELIKLD